MRIDISTKYIHATLIPPRITQIAIKTRYDEKLQHVEYFILEVKAWNYIADRPGARRKVVSWKDYDSMRRELEDKERLLDEQALELAIVKKTNGSSWER
jgi:hypothetical protein